MYWVFSLFFLFSTNKVEAYSKAYTVKVSSKKESVIPLNIIIDSESSWKKSEIKESVEVYNQFLATCDFSVSEVDVYYTSNSNFKRLDCINDHIVTESIPLFIQRPVAFFIEDSLCNYGPSFANVEYYKDHSFEHLSKNTAFIARADYIKFKEISEKASKGLLSHELSHILTNRPHNSIKGNILADALEDRGYDLTEKQCKQIKEFSLNL